MPKTELITVEEIVINYLETNGYDGLAGEECGCEISDLIPCGELNKDCVAGHCVAGHKVTKETCEIRDDCEEKLCDDSFSGGWCIIAGRKNNG